MTEYFVDLPPTHQVKVGAPQNLSYNVARCLAMEEILKEPAKAGLAFASAR
ncbi:hypothetical protein JAB1_31850 [Janthinobacterium sp. MP5059B]|nr:hypothetical protein JAB1_31850 [Janthinobacterium sp. MP5059B]